MRAGGAAKCGHTRNATNGPRTMREDEMLRALPNRWVHRRASAAKRVRCNPGLDGRAITAKTATMAWPASAGMGVPSRRPQRPDHRRAA